MATLILGLAAFVVFIVLGVFVWIWWAAPHYQVPPHFDEQDLRRLEVQDRLRQTNYQILTAIGLGATFLATVFQLSLTTRQWNSDFEFKVTQERISQYTDAIETIDPEKSSLLSSISSVTTISILAVEDPSHFSQQATLVLAEAANSAQMHNSIDPSIECGNVDPKSQHHIVYPRNEAPPLLKAAVTALGHPQFAANRLNYAKDTCAQNRISIDRNALHLEHMNLDNLDLSGRDFSCAKMSQSSFHLTSFIGADLRGADLRGTQLGDFDTPAYPGDVVMLNKLYLAQSEGGFPEWKRYRCWITDFRYAKLNDADFEGAVVAGADFRRTDLTGVNFCRADISRANFTDATGITDKMLSDACVGGSVNPADLKPGEPLPVDEAAQPIGLTSFGKNFRVPHCRFDKVCQPKGG